MVRYLVSVVVVLMLVVPASADAYVEASIHAGCVSDWSDHQHVATVLQHESYGTAGGTYGDWYTLSRVYVDPAEGVMRAYSESGDNHYVAGSATSSFSNSRVAFHDYFTIGAGDSGLPTGAEVQIRFLASFDGDILLMGQPWSASQLSFRATLSGVGHFSELFFTTGGIHPPYDQSPSQVHDELVTVHVDDILHLATYLYADLGSCSNPTAGSIVSTVDAYSTGRSQVGYAPGYEDLSITSQMGADIVPVPEPASLALLALGLAGLISRRRR